MSHSIQDLDALYNDLSMGSDPPEMGICNLDGFRYLVIMGGGYKAWFKERKKLLGWSLVDPSRLPA